MKCANECVSTAVGCCRSVFFCLAVLLIPLSLPAQETFAVLQAGSETYSNVTVTSKTPSYVIVMHARGMASIKPKDLSSDVLKQLGYKVEEPAPKTSLPQKIALDPRIQELQAKAVQILQDAIRQIDPRVIQGVLAGLVLCYFIFCYCSMLICKKAGHEPGFLVWIPVLQTFPLLKAAKMSCWCFLLLLLPVISIVVGVLWCVKICQALGKSVWLAVLLLLPLTNVLTFLYLAFSGNEDDSVPQKITFN